MKLTHATEQAVAVMAMLATQKSDVYLSSDAIYQKLNVSKSYVQKLLRKLVVANIIEGVTGLKGGFFIKRPLTDISLYEVTAAIEGEFDSFSGHDVLSQAFAGFNTKAREGHQIIASYFARADERWVHYLKNVSLDEIMRDVFSEEPELPQHDWNCE
ncbi:RrF2 family transcriptional regulator [Vagococcus acidifermentans]|uniref:Transcriptional regulator n=1 Tax=Vagococcus acidifermentans TaxID=564710 RepID=A0A430B0R8_9ENTE|nr:Rrf2 family transcriptional regulator [Vagococcus acidifermentans]RSU13896.1 hypothetical protein CBF27_03065 [Vagococcus acidifermentans]